MLQITGRERQAAVGKSVFEVYPENPGTVSITGPSTLRTSIQNAIKYKKYDQMPSVRYDVTELNLANKKLEESESPFRHMVQQAPVAITLTRGREVVIESINEHMLRIMGKEKEEEVLGKNMN